MVKDQLPAKDATTSERIAAHLRNAILAGEILPGSRIRQEEIAARFGASGCLSARRYGCSKPKG